MSGLHALWDLMLALLSFDLPLVQSFPNMPSFLYFGIGVCILCHYRLEGYNLFSFTGGSLGVLK